MASSEETRTTGTLTVTLVDSCLDVDTDEVVVELDNYLNKDTCFIPNTNIYLRLFYSPLSLHDDSTIAITNGTIYKNVGSSGKTKTDKSGATDIIYEYFVGYGEVIRTEEILITDGKGSAGYPIHSISSIEWNGDAPCPISEVLWTADRKSLVCPTCVNSPEADVESCEVTYGYIVMTYLSRFETYICNAPTAGNLLVYSYENKDDDA